MKIRQVVLWVMFLLIIVAAIFQILPKEDILKHGHVVFLDLRPVDPRALIQGDYMSLRYSITDAVSDNDYPDEGIMVVGLDDTRVGRFVRIHDPDVPLKSGEIIIRYYSTGFRSQIGPTAFFFQEGEGEYYAGAAYAELRVSDDGESILVGLRDEGLRRLGPPDE